MDNEDEILQAFITTIEDTSIEMGFTFFINGQTISGRVINTKKYLQLITENFQKSNDKTANKIGEKFNELLLEKEIDEKCSKNLKYVHMATAKIINVKGDRFHINAPLRLKVDNISGFVFGEIEDDK